MSDPATTVQCERHGTSHAAFLCGHLQHSVGAGFFSSDPTDDDPRPDAWCQRCDEVQEAEQGWNADNDAFAGVKLFCAGCYDEVRARNLHGPDDGDGETFVCGTCSEVHQGLPRDFGTPAPALPPELLQRARLTADTCVLDDGSFVRGCLEIPVLGGPGPLVYGVWVSLSPRSYDEFLSHLGRKRRYLDGPYFGWFVSLLPGWPETMHLKTRVHVRPVGLRPVIELEPTDHPLAVAQREGISRERFRELALMHLHG